MSLGSVHERPEPGSVGKEDSPSYYFILVPFFFFFFQIIELKKYQVGRNYGSLFFFLFLITLSRDIGIKKKFFCLQVFFFIIERKRISRAVYHCHGGTFFFIV